MTVAACLTDLFSIFIIYVYLYFIHLSISALFNSPFSLCSCPHFRFRIPDLISPKHGPLDGGKHTLVIWRLGLLRLLIFSTFALSFLSI